MLKLVHALDMNIESVINYYNAFTNKKDINCFAILLIEMGRNIYFDYIYKEEPYLFYLVEENNPNYIIGYGKLQNIEKTKNDPKLDTGHISCGIRPTERNKGYATRLLNLLLKKCEELGKREIYVSCFKNNIVSQKVIKNNHGILKKEIFSCKYGEWISKYQIKLHPQIYLIKRLFIK